MPFSRTPLRGGAIEKAWQALGEAFVRSGHEVTHISRLCDGLPEKENINGVHHVRILGADACTNAAILKFHEFSYVWRARKILLKRTFLSPMLYGHLYFSPKKKMGKSMFMWAGIQRGR